jgi:hypothetical protein
VFGIGSKKDGTNERVYAHRFAYEISIGPIPEGFEVCHKCDNPPCVRPDHFFLGTHSDNAQDALSKGRLICGERHPHSKLTTEQVQRLRQTSKRGEIATLAREFGVNHSVAWEAAKGVTWKSL